MSIYLPHAHLISALPFVCIGILAFSSCLRLSFPSLSNGCLCILIWAWLIAASYFTDFFNSPILIWALIVFIPLTFGSLFSLKKFGGTAKFKELNPLSELVTYFLAWMAGLGVLLVPLLFFDPENTIITGRHYSNDVVGHALLAKGAEYFRTSGIEMQLFSWYPRGFHTILFYLNGLTGYSPAQIILPFIIFCYSFVVPFSWEVARSFKINSKVAILALAIIICAPFLSLTVLYQEFAAQACAAPLILLLLFDFFVPGQTPLPLHFLRQTFLLLTGISIYSVFPITLLGLGAIVRTALYPRWVVVLLSRLKELLSLRTILLFSLLVTISGPGILATTLFLYHQTHGDPTATDILHSSGNLKGYLSPMHLSGFWPPVLDHRFRSDYTYSWIDYFQLIAIGIYLFALFKAKLGRDFTGLLVTAALPVLLIPIFGPTEYIQFKYYCLFIPIFFLATGISIFLVTPKKLSLPTISVFSFALFIFGLGTIYSGRVIGKWPTITESEYQKYMFYRHKFFSKGDLVVLTQDDWFRYFAGRKNVYVPLVGTHPTKYLGQPLKYIFLDRGANAGNNDFLHSHPDLEKSTQNASCRLYTDERVDVYKTPCS